MKTMLSYFLGPRQETTRTAFCNYLVSKVEALEERYFQRFRYVAVKLLSGIQSRAEERTHQSLPPLQPTLSRSSSTTSINVPQTFQQPQQVASAGREYIITISETQMPASQVIQPRRQQQPRGQPTSFLLVDDQQARPSRPLTFTLSPTKHFKPSVASATGKESSHIRTL